LLIVQTKASLYANQLISSIPHEEDPANYNELVIAIKLKEVQFYTSQSSTVTPVNPTNPSNGDTVNRGNQQPQTPSQGQSFAYTGAAAAYHYFTG
jgi:hypothetical protein